MGNQRLGRLSHRRKWLEVVGLLDGPPSEMGRLAAVVVAAADNRLGQLANDPALAYSLWLLVRITHAARGTDFTTELERLGIPVAADTSALSLISLVGQRIRETTSTYEWRGHFADFAALAVRTALTATVGREGPSLFDSDSQDVQRAFRSYSTEARFGELARRFFGDFLSRALRSFVDRELPNHIGEQSGIRSVSQSLDFLQALDTHTWESARIVQDFAGDWYSKHVWQTGGEVTVEETQRFAAHSLTKLRDELKRGAPA